MSQPPHGPYGGPPSGMPPQGPPTGGQPPMGPPGGMPPGGDPYGPGPGGPGDPYGQGPGGPGGPHDPYGQGPGGPSGPHDPYGHGQGGMPPGGDPYGAPYPGGPQPSQPKKTSPWLFVGLGCGGLFIIGIVLVVIIVFVANGNEDPSGGGTGTDSGTSSGPDAGGDTEPQAGTPNGPTGGTIGDSVEHEGIIFTPLEIEGPFTSLDLSGQTYTPNGEYVILWLEVEAASGSETFWRDEQHLYTSSGQAIEEDYEATGSLDQSTTMSLTLSPGSPVETGIIFDVPDADDLESIGLSAETYGGNEVEVQLN